MANKYSTNVPSILTVDDDHSTIIQSIQSIFDIHLFNDKSDYSISIILIIHYSLFWYSILFIQSHSMTIGQQSMAPMSVTNQYSTNQCQSNQYSYQ